MAGIGEFRLVRLFRERTGLPPHAFHLAHRIRIARHLLEAGETVAATAAATGFADQSHVHRHFRRSLGMTPSQYRRHFVRRPSERSSPAIGAEGGGTGSGLRSRVVAAVDVPSRPS